MMCQRRGSSAPNNFDVRRGGEAAREAGGVAHAREQATQPHHTDYFRPRTLPQTAPHTTPLPVFAPPVFTSVPHPLSPCLGIDAPTPLCVLHQRVPPGTPPSPQTREEEFLYQVCTCINIYKDK